MVKDTTILQLNIFRILAIECVSINITLQSDSRWLPN